MSEIAVIITTYKRENEIVLRAVKSLQKQTFSNLEIIVVDDNNQEYIQDKRLKEALEALGDDRIRYIAKGKNEGACAARNMGIAASKSPYICFLDDDDEYLPDKLTRQYELLSGSDAGMVVCSFNLVIDETGKLLHSRMNYSEGGMFDQLIADNHIATPNPLIKRECFEVCGVFDILMPSAQDLDMWLRIADKYEILVIEDELYTQHLHAGERISSNPEKKLSGNRRLVDKYMEYMEKHPKVYCKYLLRQGKFCIRLNRHKEAWGLLIKAIKTNPSCLFKGIGMFFFWYINRD